MQSFSTRRKGGCVRQENACSLTMRDEQLISDLDAMHYELVNSKSQVRLRGPRVGVKNSVAVMSEQILQLQAELETQATELKAAELRAECSLEAAAHGDILVATLSDELSALREELDDTTALGKRSEQQRNQALQNAEKLQEAFKDYKATISIKLKRVMESESKLKESLIKCDSEKEELEIKCTMLERGKVEQSQTISQLKEERRQAESAAAGLQAQLEEAGRKASHLERQLTERGAESRELASLRKELENLRTLTHSQEQKVAQSHREAQQSQAELAGLEAILALLHLREGDVGTLCVKPCVFTPVDHSGTAHLLKLKPGEGYQQLLRVLQSMETERTKQSGLVERLQERLSRAQEEISSLQSSMAQRASHYQNLHTELLEKVSQATNTEKELKRKSARVALLEKQLQEKTSAYSQAALTNTELDKQLLEKTSTLQHYQSLMTNKQREYQQSLDMCKKSQFTEQQHRIEMLQLSVEEAQSRVLEMEPELSSLQRQRDEAQETALRLQSSVDQLTQQRQVEVRHKEELLQSFKEQAAQSATKVYELQSYLSTCREELNLCLQQMEEVKNNYESELQKSKDKVSSLQEKLYGADLVCESSNELNLQLQLSLQQQQTMLTESTAHISELEESQSQLQKQVSSLEQQLERAQASLQGEVRSREQHAQEKDKDLQEMKQKNTQLSESVSHLSSEMTKCRGELVSKDSELQRLSQGILVDDEESLTIQRNLGPTNKVLILRNHGLVSVGETVEEAFYYMHNLVTACEIQVRTLAGAGGPDNLVLLDPAKYKSRPRVPEPAGDGPSAHPNWKVGEQEFEALMRMLDNLGYRTGYPYRCPALRDKAKKYSDAEIAPSAHSGYSYGEDSDSGARSPLKQSFQRGQRDKTRWVNAGGRPDEPYEDGPDGGSPKSKPKWTKEEGLRQAAVANQFIPMNTNPKDVLEMRNKIREQNLQDIKTAGPQSQVLCAGSGGERTFNQGELVTASKAIIEKEYQPRVIISKQGPNPFNKLTDQELDEYRKEVEQNQKGPEDVEQLAEPEEEEPQIQKPTTTPPSTPVQAEEESLPEQTFKDDSDAATLRQTLPDLTPDDPSDAPALPAEEPASAPVSADAAEGEEPADAGDQEGEESPSKSPSKKKKKFRTPSFLKKNKKKTES